MVKKKKKRTKKSRNSHKKKVAPSFIVKQLPEKEATEIVVQAETTEGCSVEISQSRTSALWQWLWPIVQTTFLLAIILGASVATIYYGFEGFYATRTLPNTFVGTIPVGGFHYEDARQKLEENFKALQQNSLSFIVDNTTYTIPFSATGITYDFDHVMQAIQTRKPHDVWSALFFPTYIASGLQVDPNALTVALQQSIPAIATSPKNASVYLAQDDKKKPYFAIIPAETHITADFAKIAQTLSTMLEQGRLLPIIVHTYQGEPDISDEEAYAAIRESERWLQKSITLTFQEKGKNIKAEIAPAKDWQWLEFTPKDSRLLVSLNASKWDELMTKTILPAIEQKKEDVTIALPVKGTKYASVSGDLQDGFTVDVVQSKKTAENAFAADISLQQVSAKTQEVTLIVNFEPARFISSEGQDLGLKDILGIGHSRFAGSSSARVYNVKKGLAIYNNVLLAPGEKLSFNSLLGPVTVKAGWKEELVIKEGGNKTVPEAGGGLCQVSTTVYRALVEAGLQVEERRAHSYLVSYYVRDDDPRTGIDATIYPGSQDLVFINDTANYILLQTDSSGVDAYVTIYGTSDGRKVELTGPSKSGWVSPSSPILIPTSSLPAGQVKITKAAHQGRTVRWTQTITRADGTVEKNDIVSVYKAIPAEGLIGAANAAEPAAITL